MNISNDIINKIKVIPLLDTLRLEDISDQEYFSEKYSDRISNSRLGLLKSKGAKAFFENEKIDLNSSLILGSALHELVLQPESFELVENVNKPTAKAGMVADYLYNGENTFPTDDDIKVASIKCNYYKDKLTQNRILEFRQKAEPYWKQRILYEMNNPVSNKERIYIDEKSQEVIKECLNSLNNNKEIQELLHPTGITEDPYTACEKTILMDIKVEYPEHEPIIYKFKAKLDHFSIDKEENTITVNDLKTTSKLAKDFKEVVPFFSYNREIAIYSWLLNFCAEKFFGLKNPKIKGNFLVSSIRPEYNTLVYPMTPKMFKDGIREFLYLMKVIAYLQIEQEYTFK